MEQKTQILETLAKYQELVHTQSPELFEEVFAHTKECHLISLDTHFEGREVILEKFLLGRIKNRFSRIDIINDGTLVNILSDDMAIVVFKYHTDCELRETGEPFGFAGLETQVMIKEENQWRILHVHYSK